MKQECVVIGAGIIGISVALELTRRGHKVRVIDRTGVAAEASLGNAGAFAFSDIEPLATPGIMRKAPKWLLDPLGPLSIPPTYALRIAPWMLRFWRASWPDRYRASVKAQTDLMTLSRAALARQVDLAGGADLIMQDGQLQLFEGEKQFQAAQPAWELRRQHGIRFTALTSPQELAEIQPGLHPRFTHGVFTPDWQSTTDPKIWTERLAQSFVSAGGTIEQADVTALTPRADGVTLSTNGPDISAGKVILAAGAWSHKLARTMGDRLPLETERGYNTTMPPGAFDLRTQLTFGGHGFVVTKIAGGVRVGGAVELGGLALPPNYKRAEVLLNKAKTFMPDLDTNRGTQWMGFRPSMPDSLPVIGAAPKSSHVVYAFGHGHLGLTQSAGTAELVADILDAAPPALDLAPYSPSRF